MDYQNFYENLEEAVPRLNGSVVLYDGSPVYINGIEEHKDGILRVRIIDLPYNVESAKDTTRKMINSPKFNKFRPFQLGFVNYLRDGAIRVYWCERIPARTRVQGTSSANLWATTISKDGTSPPRFESLIANEGFVEMCKNEYPSLKDFFESKVDQLAVHRDFAVVQGETGMIRVCYQGKSVGICNNKGTIFVFPKFKYLKEVIEESRVFNSVNTTVFE